MNEKTKQQEELCIHSMLKSQCTLCNKFFENQVKEYEERKEREKLEKSILDCNSKLRAYYQNVTSAKAKRNNHLMNNEELKEFISLTYHNRKNSKVLFDFALKYERTFVSAFYLLVHTYYTNVYTNTQAISTRKRQAQLLKEYERENNIK